MKNFQELKNRRPELAKDLESMTKEELMEHYAIELEEKDELEKYKEDNEFFKQDIEHIVNLGIDWLESNRKYDHHIYIKKGESRVTYTHNEITFI